jgi:carbon monoxide dehydrogenase subunit G
VRVENTFEVPEGRQAVWDLLMDVARVIPCVPGATLNAAVDDDNWQAQVAVTLGPVAMTFDADIAREAVDEAGGAVRLVVKAREKRGRGGATAEVESRVEEAGQGTVVTVTTDLRLQGAVARVGRPEIVEEVSQQMTDSFASCLQAQLGERGPERGEPESAPPLRFTLRTLLSWLWGIVRGRS